MEEVPHLALVEAQFDAVATAFRRHRVLLLRGPGEAAKTEGCGALGALEALYQRFPDVVESNWCVEDAAGVQAQALRRPTPSAVFQSDAAAPVDLGRRWYASFTVQGAPAALDQALAALPGGGPHALAASKDLRYKPCVWLFLGRNSGLEPLRGRLEHTDAVHASRPEAPVDAADTSEAAPAPFRGTWHAQLDGAKDWRLRPVGDAKLWGAAGLDGVPALAKAVERLHVQARAGDVLMLDTSLWLHETSLPAQDHASLSISLARDFACFDESQEAACHVTNRDAAWVRTATSAGEAVLEEAPRLWIQSSENLPECLACCRCGQVLGDPALLLQLGTGELNRASAIQHLIADPKSTVVATPTARDRLLCSSACEKAWLASAGYRLFDRYASLPRSVRGDGVSGAQDTALSQFRSLALKSGHHGAMWLAACLAAETVERTLDCTRSEDAITALSLQAADVTRDLESTVSLPAAAEVDAWLTDVCADDEDLRVERAAKGFRMVCQLHETKGSSSDMPYGLRLEEGQLPSGSSVTVVREVERGSPAWDLGLCTRDVLVRMAGERVTDLPAALAATAEESRRLADRCAGEGFGPQGWLRVEFELYRRLGGEEPGRRGTAEAQLRGLLTTAWERLSEGIAEALVFSFVFMDRGAREGARQQLMEAIRGALSAQVWLSLVVGVHEVMCEVGPEAVFYAPGALQKAATAALRGDADPQDAALLLSALSSPPTEKEKAEAVQDMAREVLDLCPDVAGVALFPTLSRVAASDNPGEANCDVYFPGGEKGLTAVLVARRDLDAGALLVVGATGEENADDGVEGGAALDEAALAEDGSSEGIKRRRLIQAE